MNMKNTIDFGNMTAKEIIAKVRSGEITAPEYHTPGEYLKAMEIP